MLFNYLILALSVSIDSLGIGITYGLKNTMISKSAKIILFIISITMTGLSVYFGNILTQLVPSYFTNLIGSLLLVCMGLWIIYQALNSNKPITSPKASEEKIYQFFIKFLGITIQIIRNPISSDLDHSKKIDVKEALYLGMALSLDSICVGICSSVIGFNSAIFPIFVALFQLCFLSIGRFLGVRIVSICQIPENIWNVLSGILLICIGISKIIGYGN